LKTGCPPPPPEPEGGNFMVELLELPPPEPEGGNFMVELLEDEWLVLDFFDFS